MDVDLDRYRTMPHHAETHAARRDALLDQLGWLADEAAALVPLLTQVPAWALEQTPRPGEHSVKETLAALAIRDRTRHTQWVERLVTEDTPVLDASVPEPDENPNARPLETLLAELRAARAAFREQIAQVPDSAWVRTATLGGESVTLYDLALGIVRHDADALRTLAYRLHEANLAERA